MGDEGIVKPFGNKRGIQFFSEEQNRDVGSSHPGGGEAPKGPAVRRLKRYASWVQSVVRQLGLYPGQPLIFEESRP